MNNSLHRDDRRSQSDDLLVAILYVRSCFLRSFGLVGRLARCTIADAHTTFTHGPPQCLRLAQRSGDTLVGFWGFVRRLLGIDELAWVSADTTMPRSKTRFGRYIERDTLSTRVLAPPGGASSISLTWDTSTAAASSANDTENGSWSAPTMGYAPIAEHGASPSSLSTGAFSRGGGGADAYYERQATQRLRQQQRRQQHGQPYGASMSHRSDITYGGHGEYDDDSGYSEADEGRHYQMMIEQSKRDLIVAQQQQQQQQQHRHHHHHNAGYGHDDYYEFQTPHAGYAEEEAQQQQQQQQQQWSKSAYVAQSGVIHDSLAQFMDPQQQQQQQHSPHEQQQQPPRRQQRQRQRRPTKMAKQRKQTVVGFGSSQPSDRGSLGGSRRGGATTKNHHHHTATPSLAERRRQELAAAQARFRTTKHRKIRQAARASGERFALTPRSHRRVYGTEDNGDEAPPHRRSSNNGKRDKYAALSKKSEPLRELTRPLLDGDAGGGGGGLSPSSGKIGALHTRRERSDEVKWKQANLPTYKRMSYTETLG